MPKYEVNREFWWKGLKQEVGATVLMTEAEARYLTHVVTPLATIAAALEPKKVSRKPTAAAPTPLSVAVVEEPSDGDGSH